MLVQEEAVRDTLMEMPELEVGSALRAEDTAAGLFIIVLAAW